jgi:Type VI secretion system (T6SS), amidase effector protein 4
MLRHFTQTDPMPMSGGAYEQSYAYGMNNPVRFVDPSGRRGMEPGDVPIVNEVPSELAFVAASTARSSKKKLKFADLLKSYPQPYERRPDRTPASPKVPVNDDDGDTFLYFNQCAIRMSIALRGAGLSLKGVKNYSNPGGQVYAGPNVAGAYNLARFLDTKIGWSAKSSGEGRSGAAAKGIQGKTGILFFRGIVEDGVRGPSMVHMDLWDRDHYQSSFDFGQMFDATEIWFWEIK